MPTWPQEREAATLLHEQLVLQLLRILWAETVGLPQLPIAQAGHAAQRHGGLREWQRQRVARHALHIKIHIRMLYMPCLSQSSGMIMEAAHTSGGIAYAIHARHTSSVQRESQTLIISQHFPAVHGSLEVHVCRRECHLRQAIAERQGLRGGQGLQGRDALGWGAARSA